MEKAAIDLQSVNPENEEKHNDERHSLLSNDKSYRRKLKGTLLGFVIVLFFTTSAVSVQLLERRIPDLELNTIREWRVLRF